MPSVTVFAGGFRLTVNKSLCFARRSLCRMTQNNDLLTVDPAHVGRKSSLLDIIRVRYSFPVGDTPSSSNFFHLTASIKFSQKLAKILATFMGKLTNGSPLLTIMWRKRRVAVLGVVGYAT
jgi:hypothetical protein